MFHYVFTSEHYKQLAVLPKNIIGHDIQYPSSSITNESYFQDSLYPASSFTNERYMSGYPVSIQ